MVNKDDYIQEFAEFRATMIEVAKGIDKNQDELKEVQNDLWKRLNDLNEKVNTHCVSYENRFTRIEDKAKENNKLINGIIGDRLEDRRWIRSLIVAAICEGIAVGLALLNIIAK